MRVVGYQLLVFASFILLATSVQAQVSTWDGGTTGDGNSWNIAANWVGDALPISGGDLVFDQRNGSGTIVSPMAVGSKHRYLAARR